MKKKGGFKFTLLSTCSSPLAPLMQLWDGSAQARSESARGPDYGRDRRITCTDVGIATFTSVSRSQPILRPFPHFPSFFSV